MTAPPARRQWLAAITLAVLAAHFVLLTAANVSLQAPDPFATRSLVTRTIVLAPAEPERAAPPTPQPAPVPRALRAARVASVPAALPAALTAPPEAAPPATQAAAVQPLAPEPPAAAAPEARTTPTALALAIPGSARLHYKVFAVYRGQDRQASGQLHWRHDGVNYEAKLEMSVPLLPTRTQHSAGRITAEGLAPLRFSDKGRAEEATHFERDKGRIVFSTNKPEAVLMTGAQDRLSVVLQLAALAGGSPAKFRAGSSITVQTAGTRDAEPWVFTVEGEEQLQLPGGAVHGLKLTRNPRKEYDQKIEVWLAPAMDYVPVRLRLTNSNGDSFDQQWSGTDRG